MTKPVSLVLTTADGKDYKCVPLNQGIDRNIINYANEKDMQPEKVLEHALEIGISQLNENKLFHGVDYEARYDKSNDERLMETINTISGQ